MRLAILDDYQGVALFSADWGRVLPAVETTIFRAVLPDATAVAERLKEYEILVAMRQRTEFPRAILERLPKLKLLVTTGMRNASIDMVAAAERGVLVCGTGLQEFPAAELTWGLLLALARHIPREERNMREGRWQTTVGVGLHGKTLGVVGLGKLGGQVAGYGKAFGMEVIAWSQNLTAERAVAAGAALVSKEELFRRADFITIHLVLSERTRHTVGAAEFAVMKPTARLVNTSRGPIIVETALVSALQERRIAGAALDVYDVEPLPADHPLWRLDNVVRTPHIGYVTEENYRFCYGQAVEDVQAFLDGQPVRVLNHIPPRD